jgi:hypothetical protein
MAVNVRDVISPSVFLFFQFFGYGIFLAAWIVIWFAIFRGSIELQRILSPKVAMAAGIARNRDARSTKILLFPTPAVRRAGRGY